MVPFFYKKTKFRKNLNFMLRTNFFILITLMIFSCQTNSDKTEDMTDKKTVEVERAAYALAIHGGAGTIKRESLTAEKDAEIRKALDQALSIGEDILKNGGSSIDAVEATIMSLENSPHFNAGKGAVFTNEGINELDASFMDGKTKNAGAVGGIRTVKNPIRAARAVLEKSDHVLLTGSGADQFAKEQGLELVDPEYFYTKRRWESLERAKARDIGYNFEEQPFFDSKFGTVGCAALDKHGNLAAGTSTGGMTNKKYNRLGDSPIIGAGTYADNNTCAVSCTGHGEFFIRYAVAHDISAMMEYGKVDFQTAADKVVNEKLKQAGGSGGVIGVDKYGNVALPFNTPGMYRGYVKPGEKVVKIYSGE